MRASGTQLANWQSHPAHLVVTDHSLVDQSKVDQSKLKRSSVFCPFWKEFGKFSKNA